MVEIRNKYQIWCIHTLKLCKITSSLIKKKRYLHHFADIDYPIKGKLREKSETIQTKLFIGAIIAIYLIELLLVSLSASLILISCAPQDMLRNSKTMQIIMTSRPGLFNFIEKKLIIQNSICSDLFFQLNIYIYIYIYI